MEEQICREELEKVVSIKRLATALEIYFTRPGGNWYSLKDQAQGLDFAQELKKAEKSEDLEGFVNRLTPLQYLGPKLLFSIRINTRLSYLNDELASVLGELSQWKTNYPWIFLYWNPDNKKLEYDWDIFGPSG